MSLRAFIAMMKRLDTTCSPAGTGASDILSDTYPRPTAPLCCTVLHAQVYCSKEKAATLAACGLAPRYANLITTNHLEANIHAVSGGARLPWHHSGQRNETNQAFAAGRQGKGRVKVAAIRYVAQLPSWPPRTIRSPSRRSRCSK